MDYAYCHTCDQLLDDSQMISVMDQCSGVEEDTCACCESPVDPADVILDNQDFFCDRCCQEFNFGCAECSWCNETYSWDYWESVLQMSLKIWFSHPQDHIDAAEAYFITLCCNQPIELCSCDLRIEWNDTHLIPKDKDEEAYEYTSPCSGCKQYYTAQCMPYRSWCLEFLTTGSLPGRIDFCSFYCPVPEVVDDSEYDYSMF